MRPFGAAKAKKILPLRLNELRAGDGIRAAITPRDTRAIIKTQPPVGGVKLIPRMSLRESPATANARNAVKTPDGRLMQFFR